MKHLELAFAALAACTGIDEPAPLVAQEPPTTCRLPDGFDVTRNGEILFEGDMIVGTMAELEADCAAGRPWRGFDRLPRGPGRHVYGTGVTSASVWPLHAVPYKIDPALPDGQTRVEDAVKYWGCIDTDPGNCGVNSSIFFYKRTTETDYVYFTNTDGDTCSSAGVGHQGGKQLVHVMTPLPTSQLVGTVMTNVGTTYSYYDNGLASQGTPSDVGSIRAQFPYKLPGGYSAAQVVGMAMANNAAGMVFVWFDDNKVSSGSTDQLDAFTSPQLYTKPAGKTIAEIDIASNGDVYAWYTDGTFSIGTTTNLTARQCPRTYTPDGTHTIAQIKSIAMDSSNNVYTWYSDSTFSIGTSSDLDSAAPASSFKVPNTACPTYKLAHEVGHVLGLAHEQTRCDRDDHVRVYEDNIDPTKLHNYDRHVLSDDVTCDPAWQDIGAYDVHSRMHYESFGFPKQGVTSPTMLAIVDAGLPIAKADVADMAIDPTGQVYTWWKLPVRSGGTSASATAGTTADLERDRSRFDVDMKSKTMTDVAGIGIGPNNGNVYVFYKDKTRSIGHIDDATAVSGPVSYALPSGYDAEDIVAIDIAPDSHVWAWYANGWVSSGTSTDLAAYTSPQRYSLAPNQTPTTLLGIAIGTGGSVWAWYQDGTVSKGTATDLDSLQAPQPFSGRLDEIDSWETLTPGDVLSINILYP